MSNSDAKLLQRVTALLTSRNPESPASLRHAKRQWASLTSKQRGRYRRTYERMLEEAGEGWPVGGMPAPLQAAE